MLLPTSRDASGDSTQASCSWPVPWYLIVWILLTLSVNSMSQPSGRICGCSVRYRIYLCSSPLFAFSDGLSIVIRIIAASLYLYISPLKSSRLAIIARADERHHVFRNKDSCFDDPFPYAVSDGDPVPPSSGATATWPRWLFFVVGTAPAAIQLASFSGVPRTQILGLMFISSFIVIELITFLASFGEKCKTIPSLLGYLKVGGIAIEEQGNRFKVFKLMRVLEWIEITLFLLTILAHLVLMYHVIYPVMATFAIPICIAIHQQNTLKLMYAILQTIFNIIQGLVILRLILPLFGSWPKLDRYMPLMKAFWIWSLSSTIFNSIPYNPKNLIRPGFLRKMIAMYDVFLLFWPLHLGVSKLCARFPIIARALLLDRRPWDTAKLEHVPAKDITANELETGVIHFNAWICFCLFLTNWVFCLLWYKFVYNCVGTVNPSWTYVFG